MPEMTPSVETDQHDWADVPEGTALTRGVAFRFCSRCDREEWADGTVRPGERECAPPRPAHGPGCACPWCSSERLAHCTLTRALDPHPNHRVPGCPAACPQDQRVHEVRVHEVRVLEQAPSAPTDDAAMLDAIRELVDEATGYSVPYKRSRFMPIDSAFTNALKEALGVPVAQACVRAAEGQQA